LTQGYAQEPILYTWGQFLFFKIFGHSLFTTWFFPALCSLLAIPLAWGTARKASGPYPAFLVLCLMGLAYWPLYLGRISVQSALMVPWEWLVFFLPCHRHGLLYIPRLAAGRPHDSDRPYVYPGS
jgi:hypothetical protein